MIVRHIFIVLTILTLTACTSPAKIKQAYDQGYRNGYAKAEGDIRGGLGAELRETRQQLSDERERSRSFNNSYRKLYRTVKQFFGKRECLIFREGNNGDVALAENNVCRALNQ